MKDEDDMTPTTRDPRHRRPGAFAPIDARAAAASLEAAADAMRAEQLERRNAADEPPTGLLDLAAIRAALGAEPGGEVNPAAAAWLAGEPVGPLGLTRPTSSLEPVGGVDPFAEPDVDEPAEPTCFDTSHDHSSSSCLGPAVPEPECCCGTVRPGESCPAHPFDPTQYKRPDPIEVDVDEHTHPYFVEGCAECVERAEQLEALEDAAREPEPVVDVVPVEVPPSPEPPPVAEPVAPVPPPAAAPVVVPAVFSSEHPPLSWRSRHDPRSRQYGVRSRLAGSTPVQDCLLPTGPVFDQGREGACFGMAAAAAINSARLSGDLTPAAPLLTVDDALALYHLAQRRDDVPGEDYSGTSVTGGMTAAVELGLCGGYLWDFGTRDVAQTILGRRAAVIIGVPWLSGMYDTGPGGLVELAGTDQGLGHCLAVVGIKMHGPQGQLGPYFRWQNSWGTDYGDAGFGYIHHRDLATLLHGTGEAAIPTRAAQHV